MGREVAEESGVDAAWRDLQGTPQPFSLILPRHPRTPRRTTASPVSPASRHRRIPTLRRRRRDTPRQLRLTGPALRGPALPFPPLQLRPGAQPCPGAAQEVLTALRALRGSAPPPLGLLPIPLSPSSTNPSPASRSLPSSSCSLPQQQGPGPAHAAASQRWLPAAGLPTAATHFLRGCQGGG